MTMKDYTHLVLIVDRSGSMSSLAPEASKGINALIEEQATLPSAITVSLYQFDNEYEKVFGPIPAKNAPKYTLAARGMTALLDATGRAIAETGEFLASLHESNRPDKVLVAIITDGQENASHEYTRAQVREMITKQESQYSWEFIFQGANIDAFAEASSIGVSAAAQYQPTADSVAGSYAGLSSTIYYTRSKNVSMASTTPKGYDEDGNPIN